MFKVGSNLIHQASVRGNASKNGHIFTLPISETFEQLAWLSIKANEASTLIDTYVRTKEREREGKRKKEREREKERKRERE